MTEPKPSKGDFIDIEGLSIRTIIGIFDEERVRKQEVVLFLRMYTDMTAAARSDQIEDAVDYKSITKRVIALVRDSEFFLLERMAEQVAQLVLEHSAVQQVRVRVEKPGALRYARTVAVTIERCRAS